MEGFGFFEGWAFRFFGPKGKRRKETRRFRNKLAREEQTRDVSALQGEDGSEAEDDCTSEELEGCAKEAAYRKRGRCKSIGDGLQVIGDSN